MLSESTVQRLRALTNFPAIIGFLSRDLDWPVDADNIVEEDLDDLTFEYTPDELGIDNRYSARITRIRQLRNLVDPQPWGIFYIEFESRRLPVTALRRVLNRLVRATEDRPGWQMEDLLFICVQGAPGERGVAFAHFRKGDSRRLPELRTFSWDSRESHFYYIRNLNLEKLRWPDDDTDLDAWREQWRSAFTTRHRGVIDTSQTLAREMAKQAREIRELVEDLYEIETRDGSLHKLFERFRKGLLHDLTPDTFADVIAQTVTYGLFSAAEQNADIRFEQVVDAIPQTNPFLKELLQALIDDQGIDLGDLGVDRLIDLYHDANVPEIAHNFMRQTGSGAEDPVIHFYEQFLNQYDREQRVERGVFYTPNPVVSYIVRSVDHLLKTEFGIADGLASSDKAANPATGDEEHVVQVLDPATGTGTFLQYIIEEIARIKNPDARPTPEWNRYVAEDLLPRLNGFELMMAPYTVAHMKLGLKLEQTGYRFEHDQRLRVFLTNTLDKPGGMQVKADENVRQDTLPGEFDYLSRESNAAAVVKRSRPIMVVIGNPPYSGHSANKIEDDWIGLQDYYTLDGKPLGERNPKWLQDDYVKFIRFGQKRIEQTGAGVLAFITNHGYLDNPTFRGMRESLLQTFDAIYVMDLHGNANKKETAPDGGKDENVFDIRQGVAIGLFVKHPAGDARCCELAEVHHAHLYGDRDSKYERLLVDDEQPIAYTPIESRRPFHLFIPQDVAALVEYQMGWKQPEIFVVNSMGVVTGQDSKTIAYDRSETQKKLASFSLEDESAIVRPYSYRPFDIRYILYESSVITRDRLTVMQHMLHHESNYGICTTRQVNEHFKHTYVSKLIVDNCITSTQTGERSYLFPIYIYPESDFDDRFETSTYPLSDKGRRPNLNPEFVADMETRLGLRFITEGRGDLVETFGPEDVFHYAYAVFHSPAYRERYAEFLKIDFPRLPLTTDLVLFNKLCAKGADLVALHLLDDDYAAASWNLDGEESPLKQHGVTFHEGTDERTVGKFSGRNYVSPLPEGEGSGVRAGRVYLDSSKKDVISYFEGIEPEVWEFQIGGYQVLHKWLYDRRTTGSQDGRQLTDEDVEHYKRVVASLRMTSDLMRDIDLIIDEHGGWPLRGSQPDEDEEKNDMSDDSFPKSERDLFGQRSPQQTLGDHANSTDNEDEIPPDELTSDMIERNLQSLAGVEVEVNDSDYRLSTETDEDTDEDIQPFDPKKINIVPRTLTVQQLITKIQDYEDTDGEIGMNLRPDFQRMGGIWSDEKQSRLMESMMIRIPLPAFYINESEGNEDLWLVIDGLQRLTAMRRFMLDKTLRLKKLEFWKEYEGYTFEDLPLTLRRRIEETQVSIYLVKEGTPHNVKFNIFKRINTGGAPLSGQEIRHALNQGAATDLLAEFAALPEFKSATAHGVSPMRMTDRECVLRFLAFMEKDGVLREEYDMRDMSDYSRRDELDAFLNEQLKALNAYLGNRKNPNLDRWQQLEDRFKRVMTISRDIFDNRAFRKPNDSGRRSPVSKALFEVWAVNLDRCTDEELATLVTNRQELEAAFGELMNDTDFVISISYSTSNEKRVQYRFKKIHDIIQETLANV